jgi:hypothetical protein
MTTAQVVDDELVAELARGAVAKTAPQELPLFRATSRAYFDDPESVLQAQRGKDEMLGFGVEVALTLLTPIALTVAKDVVQYLAGVAATTAKDESAPVVRRLVRRMFGRFAGDAAPAGTPADTTAALTSGQLEEVRRLAREKALQLDVPEAQADLLADSIVGDLVTTP